MASLDDLPDLVLVEIFSLLTMPDRARNARVCRRWKSLLQDCWMWRHADLPFQEIWGRCSWDPHQGWVRLRDFWHDLPCYIGSSLQSLRLQGYRVSCDDILNMSSEFFEDMGLKCPNLQRLSLHMAHPFFMPLSSLPRSLRRLEIHSCDIAISTWPHIKAEGVLPHLEQLVLDHMPSFRDHHLQYFRCFPELRSLVLAGIYDLSETGLDIGLQKVSHLQRIEVLGCKCSADNALQAISSHLREVRYIRLTVNGLSGLGLASLEGIPSLESLSLLAPADTSEVRTLTTQLLSSCLTLPRLRVLELQGQGWEGHEAKAMLKEGLPHCRVIIGAAPPQTLDWWRFINNRTLRACSHVNPFFPQATESREPVPLQDCETCFCWIIAIQEHPLNE